MGEACRLPASFFPTSAARSERSAALIDIKSLLVRLLGIVRKYDEIVSGNKIMLCSKRGYEWEHGKYGMEHRKYERLHGEIWGN
jgi:hypothetical protein